MLNHKGLAKDDMCHIISPLLLAQINF